MTGMTIKKAAELCGGRLCNFERDRELVRVVIDSRTVAQGDLFVAFKGEKADGGDFIPSALERGAACCLAASLPEGAGGPVIVVPDVQLALEKICEAYRGDLRLPIIGVTGSVGKTTAKEMIASVLSTRLRVLKTDKNLNNQIGVPMTVSRIGPEHEAAVIEMGISGFGEMSRLAQIARPDIAVFTVIGHAHLEFLHDLDGVLRAKTEMLDYMADSAPVIVNGDDEMLRRLKCRQRVLRCGLRPDCDVRAEDVRPEAGERTRCRIVFGERSLEAVIPAYGRHMIYAALLGAAVGFELGLSDGEIAAGIAAYETVGRRGAVTDTGFLTLVDDSYNANPDSVKSGVDSLLEIAGRHICILGDMLELGEDSGALHFDVGRYALARGIDRVLTCGELALQISLGAGGIAEHFDSREELLAALPELLKGGDAVLVKASRGMRFEEIAEAVKHLGQET